MTVSQQKHQRWTEPLEGNSGFPLKWLASLHSLLPLEDWLAWFQSTGKHWPALLGLVSCSSYRGSQVMDLYDTGTALWWETMELLSSQWWQTELHPLSWESLFHLLKGEVNFFDTNFLVLAHFATCKQHFPVSCLHKFL